MKVVIQRVKEASVRVNTEVVGEIGRGLVLLIGFGRNDTEECIDPMVEKIVAMRIFPNDEGRFDRSVVQVEGSILAISQFTLYADTSKGRRPEFFGALEPSAARALFEKTVAALKASSVKHVATGVFGAMMEVSLINEGPVTITLER